MKANIYMPNTLIINHYFIKNNIVLNLIKNPFYIFIKTLTGKTITIYCNKNDKVFKIKELIFKKEKTSFEILIALIIIPSIVINSNKSIIKIISLFRLYLPLKIVL